MDNSYHNDTTYTTPLLSQAVAANSSDVGSVHADISVMTVQQSLLCDKVTHSAPDDSDHLGELSHLVKTAGLGNETKSEPKVSPWPIYIVGILFFIPDSIGDTILSTLLYNKLCYHGYDNISLCSNKSFTTTHPHLQTEQAAWSNYISLIQLPFSIVTTLLLSSYCDKVGHKLPLLLPLVGNMLAVIYLAVLCIPQLIDWPMSSVLVFPVLNRMFGGYPLLMMVEFSYVTTITPLDKRPTYLALAEGTIEIGFLIGNTINGFIIDHLGLATLAAATAAVSILSPLVAFLLVKEVAASAKPSGILGSDVNQCVDDHQSASSQPRSPQSQPALNQSSPRIPTTSQSSARRCYGVGNLFDAFRTVFRSRDGYLRLLLVTSFILYSLPQIGSMIYSSAAFLYFVKQIGMTMSEYSVFRGFSSAILGFGGPCFVYIIKRLFNPGGITFSLICGALITLGYVFMFQNSVVLIWIGSSLLVSQSAFFAIVRTIQTKFCSHNDLGRMFAFDAIIQCVLSTVTAVTAKYIYTSSLAVWPALFLAVCSTLGLGSMLVSLVMMYFQNKHHTYMEVNG